MREFTLGANDGGQRYDRWLAKAVPLLPPSLAQKYFRRKRFKCNGKPAKADHRLQSGDRLELYLNDEFFQAPSPENAYLRINRPRFQVVYEDQHILLADKPAGLLSHADEEGDPNSLLTHIQAYLYQTKAWQPQEELSFAPALCNRIDRNTSGIVIAAKTAPALRAMNEKIKLHQTQKEYLAILQGTPRPPEGKLSHFLLRDLNKKQVSVYDRPCPGGKSAHTLYRVLAQNQGLSLVHCQLLTGRTHQIRAQFAHIGHPLLGDGKYGNLKDSKAYGRSGQALCAYRLHFPKTQEEGPLSYLEGRSFQVAEVDFLLQFFPDFAQNLAP